MLLLSVYAMSLLAVLGVIVDRIVGEPRGRHPLVAFGQFATKLEARLNTGHRARRRGFSRGSSRWRRPFASRGSS